MNKIQIFFLLLFIAGPLGVKAQRLAVESFQLRPNDLSARKNQRVDLNGKPCALLKVMVLDNVTKCSAGSIGDIVTDGPVKLVYVTSATPSVELSFQYHYPVTLNFTDYGFNRLEGASTYEVALVEASAVNAVAGKSTETKTGGLGQGKPQAESAVEKSSVEPVRQTSQDAAVGDDKAENVVGSNSSMLKKDLKNKKRRLNIFRKEGWVAADGALPLDSQLDNLLQVSLDKYILGDAIGTAIEYDGARENAHRLVLRNIAARTQNEIFSLMDNAVADGLLQDNDTIRHLKELITWNIKNDRDIVFDNLINVVELHRVLPNKNHEYLLNVAVEVPLAKKAIKLSVQDDFNSLSADMQEKLDKIIGW